LENWNRVGRQRALVGSRRSVRGCRIYLAQYANAPPRLRRDELQFVPVIEAGKSMVFPVLASKFPSVSRATMRVERSS
jgi:hypothetical protein